MKSRLVTLVPLLTTICAGFIWYIAAANHTLIAPWPLLLVGVGVAVRGWQLRGTRRNSEEPRGIQPSILSPQPSVLHVDAPRTTPFFVLLALFVLTALVGAWAAYDPVAGWGKFWVLLSGAVLFGIIVTQKPDDRGLLLGFLSLVAGWVAVQFLLTHDWTLLAADIGILNRLGLAWMDVRPQLPLPALHPNFAGGILIMLLPFQVAGIVGTRPVTLSRRHLVSLLLLGLSLLGLLLSSSRGAWLSLAAATLVWSLWLMSGWLAKKLARPRRTVFLAGVAVGIAAAILLVLIFPGGLIGLVNRLPGLASGESRWEIYQNTIRLVGDYPFTGGGLHSFPGLYSRYILNIPYFLFDYSHNLYLDVLLEHGELGFLIFMALFLGGLKVALGWELRGNRGNSENSAELSQSSVLSTQDSLRWAAIVSLVAVLLHGLMDNALHGGVGTPLLFVSVALALWATPVSIQQPVPRKARVGWKTSLAGLVVFLLLGVWLLRPLRADWQANLGAVALAKAELAGWPEPERGTDEAAVQAAMQQLKKALTTNSANLTANYRLGLLAVGEMEYAAALPYLEAAYQADPGHRGVIKTLGYSYVWSGQLDNAAPLLSQIPEVPGELDTYSWWWGTQDRTDLAEYAAAMNQLLSNR